MENNRFAYIAALMALLAMLLTACTQPAMPAAAPAAPESETTAPAGATAAGELIVYTSRAESLFKPVVEAFN
ncbi:MAG TPA: ABC transporter substrate-binding protein, partial [Caldilinea sp.]|nr:ABC transporter substrate-binding protein [Caldilinea sp.]